MYDGCVKKNTPINETEKWEPEDNNWNNAGQIRQFYAGKRILLTGCTGFLGTAIVEKLLRTCLEIDKIYLMVRPKKNMTIDERINKYFQDPVFDALRKTNPNFMAKVQAIYGDLLKVNLDISPEDYRLLTKNIDIIIHNAANVSFVASVSAILKANVLGTKYMLDMAARCSSLKAFVYVSTAYSHCYNKTIEEKFYAPPCDLKVVEDIIKCDESTPNGISERSVRDILGKWVNTYTFSKSIAESLVEDFSRRTSVACSIYRPSIVISAYYEPHAGWLGNLQGPAPLLLLAGIGLMHVIPISEYTIVDFVPVDLTANALLASVWDLISHMKPNEPHVYNYGASDWKPFYFLAHKLAFFEILEDYPFNNTVWYPFIITVRSLYAFVALHILFHLIPAALCDSVLFVMGKKRKALKIAWKFTTLLSPIYIFLSSNWVIQAKNAQNILIHMNSADYKEFPFDFARVNWTKGTRDYAHSLKSNAQNEQPYMLMAARKKYKKLKMAHYTLCTVALLFAVFLFYRIICRACC